MVVRAPKVVFSSPPRCIPALRAFTLDLVLEQENKISHCCFPFLQCHCHVRMTTRPRASTPRSHRRSRATKILSPHHFWVPSVWGERRKRTRAASRRMYGAACTSATQRVLRESGLRRLFRFWNEKPLLVVSSPKRELTSATRLWVGQNIEVESCFSFWFQKHRGECRCFYLSEDNVCLLLVSESERIGCERYLSYDHAPAFVIPRSTHET